MFGFELEEIDQSQFDLITRFFPRRRRVSGTYRSPAPAGSGTILELRVDVDGTRPMNRISGDFFKRSPLVFVPFLKKGFSNLSILDFYFTIYQSSFVVETVTSNHAAGEIILTGPVIHYNDPGNTSETIEVRIPHVTIFAPAPEATVRFYKAGKLISSFCCDKISEYFRKVTLEIDRYQGTSFPQAADTHAGVHPADLLQEDMTTTTIFQRSGIDMSVIEDDVINDPDSDDPGSNWDVVEVHDLMEAHFDKFANTLQWNLYGLVVPAFESSTLYGVMFDWGGYQAGDTYLRQGAAIAEDTIESRTGTLYDTAAEKDRLILQTFIHEIGHAFNLPHSWQRSDNPDSASNSFMNYPWGYTGGQPGEPMETEFWRDFRWEFDDVELIWMRHQDRNDVIFGGNDWIGNNLSTFMAPEIEMPVTPVSLEVRAKAIYDYAEPVHVEIKLENNAGIPLQVDKQLRAEHQTLRLYIERPDGEIVHYVAPVRLESFPDFVILEPGEALYESVLISYSANGLMFSEPGEYKIRAFYFSEGIAAVSQSCRLRVATPKTRAAEELAYLLFSPQAVKFMYLGGSSRYPETTERLMEATERYAKVEPAVVQHIHFALGKHLLRDRKVVVEKNGRRVVTLKEGNHKDSIRHLEAALELPADMEISALDNITHNKVAQLLAQSYLRQNEPREAERVLRQSMAYLKGRNVIDAVMKDYQEQIKKLSE